MANLYNKEKYTIELPYVDGQDSDVTVGVNGTLYKIQRGVEVTVPASVYEVLMESKQMDKEAKVRRMKGGKKVSEL